MGSDKHSKENQSGISDTGKREASPEWADGLKQLYDAVVDEPLPDAFKDLLDQLDSSETPDRSKSAPDPDSAH